MKHGRANRLRCWHTEHSLSEDGLLITLQGVSLEESRSQLTDPYIEESMASGDQTLRERMACLHM
jgi:hypothetical protein